MFKYYKVFYGNKYWIYDNLDEVKQEAGYWIKRSKTQYKRKCNIVKVNVLWKYYEIRRSNS